MAPPIDMPDPNADKDKKKKPGTGLPPPSTDEGDKAPKHNMPQPTQGPVIKKLPPQTPEKPSQKQLPPLGKKKTGGGETVKGMPAPNPQPVDTVEQERRRQEEAQRRARDAEEQRRKEIEQKQREEQLRKQEADEREREAAAQREATRLAEEQRQREAEEAQRREDEEQRAQEAAAQRKRDEEQRRQEQLRAQEAAAQRQQQEEQRQREAEEQRRREAEQRKREEERVRREEAEREAEAQRKREEEETQRLAEEEARKTALSERVVWVFPEEPVGSSTPQRHCPAIDGNGRLYFTTSNRLVGFSEVSGQFKLLGEYETGGRIPGPPVVGKDGQVRIHSEDGHLHFVNPFCESSAKPVRVGQPLGHAAPLADADGNTWINLFEGQILKVPPQPGEDPEEFTFEPERFDCTGLIREGVLYVGAENGCVYAFPLDDDGDSTWDYLAGEGKTGWFVNSAIAAGADETVIVASRDEFLYAFDRTGKQVWSVECGGQVLGAPVVDADGAIYLGLSVTRGTEAVVGELLKFDTATQRIRWRLAVAAAVESTPVIGDDGTIYFGDNDGQVHAASATGELIWSAQVPAAVRSSGTIHQGKVLFGMENGQYVALRCDSQSIQMGIWPKLLGNLAMTG